MLKKILIIDDEPINLMILEELLSDLNVKVISSHSGKEAIKAAQNMKDTNQNIDLIITDVNMPEMCGFETSKKIKAIGFENTPVIVASANEANEAKMSEYKCDEFFLKPFDINKILQKIRAAIAYV